MINARQSLRCSGPHQRLIACLFACVVAWSTSTALGHHVTTRVSVNSNGVQGNNFSGATGLSADGRFVVMESAATNLVSGDTNGVVDIFVHDRLTQDTTRVSVDSSGVQANFESAGSVISADGRCVAFWSPATNLVPGDTSVLPDIFVHDRVTKETTRVSVDSSGAESNGQSYGPSISADGSIVAFVSDATNLVPGDTNGSYDVFVHDRLTGVTSRVSVSSNGDQAEGAPGLPAISADGRYVAFPSDAANLVDGDTNALTDVFVHDRLTGQTTRVSLDSSGAQANSFSGDCSISADGSYVAFNSSATNLVADDSNQLSDVFMHDRVTGQTTCVSVDSSGLVGNHGSYLPDISGDGRHVTFMSEASNLVPGDTNSQLDVFTRDRQTGSTRRASVSTEGAQANDGCWVPAISLDGRYVAFFTGASTLVSQDTNAVLDGFVRGPEFTLEVVPLVVQAGQIITKTIYEGVRGHGASLWAVRVDTIPIFQLIAIGTFKSDGTFSMSGTVPEGLGSIDVTLRGYCINLTGFVVEATNDVTVSFR